LVIDPTLLSLVSALFGAIVGGTASLLGAVYTQRHQDRIRRSTHAKESLSKSLGPDPLLTFSEICRVDLDSVRRSAA